MSAFFDKSVPKSCVWCEHGIKSDYSNEIFCKKRGVVGLDSVCRKYRYDPLKRTPKSQTVSKNYKAEDFCI